LLEIRSARIRRGPNPNDSAHPGGKRIAIFKDPAAAALNQITQVNFVFNFLDEVRNKVGPCETLTARE
jgi:hypothetical protein